MGRYGRGAGRQAGGRRAFTLIELLLVLVILAILAAVVVPKLTGRSEDAKKAAAKADIATIDGQLETFEIDAGRYPTNDEGLGALVNAPGNVKSWKGPYVKRLPNDPWGNPYQYRYPGQYNKNGFDLFSMGPDQHEGGGDDIDNWSDSSQQGK